MKPVKTRDKYWKLWDLAQEDPQYRMLLLRLRELDREYDRVMGALPDADRDAVSDFVSLCEAMSGRILEIACETMDFAE